MIKRIQADHHKLQKRIVALVDTTPDSLQASDYISPETLFEGIVAVDKLKLLNILYIQGYTYKEMSEKCNVPLSTFAMRVKRSKEKFQKFYK